MYSRNRNVPIVTYILLAIQIAVFVLETVSGGSTNTNVLVTYGAKVNFLIGNGDWWRLITPMFVHIGFTHILINSLTLYFAGSQLEDFLGHTKFAAIYFISGIVGNLTGFAFGADIVVSAGASTGLFGLFAVYGALAYLNKSNMAMRTLGRQFMMLIVLNLAMDLFMTQIDIWGHIGGAIGGLLATFIVSKNFSENRNILFRIGSSLVLLVLVVFLYSHGMESITF